MKKKTVRYILAFMMILAITVLAGCGVNGSNQQPKEPAATGEKQEEKVAGPGAGEAKQQLVNGNIRFSTGQIAPRDLSVARRTELAEKGQKPFAIILTCSDSRVPPELIFDQGLGDIFVIRTAGNVVDPIALGSIEYGVEHLKAPLVVVMGHENCGAVKAAIEAGDQTVEGNIGTIVDKIRPSVRKAKSEGITGIDLPEKVTEENVEAVMTDLEEKSPVLKEALEKGHLSVLGAKYDLDEGTVKWIQ